MLISDVMMFMWCHCFNSLGPSDAIWRQRSGSTLAQVMACCLKALSHYINQCWLIISKVSDIRLRASSQEITEPSITEVIWKIKYRYLKFHSNFPGANEQQTRWFKIPYSSIMLCFSGLGFFQSIVSQIKLVFKSMPNEVFAINLVCLLLSS